jgi:hypothetical protein
MRNIIEDNCEGINGIKWEHSWEYKASGEMPIKQYKGMVISPWSSMVIGFNLFLVIGICKDSHVFSLWLILLIPSGYST